MNDLIATFGLLDWKPLVGALLLPPVPLMVLLLLSWRWRARRPAGATLLLLLTLVLLWLSHTQAVGRFLERQLAVTPTLSATRLAELRREVARGRPLVLMLGGGTIPLAPEYGEAHLSDRALQRLHYALWLGRQLPAPVMASGGIGLAQTGGPAEAEVAGRLAARDYGRPLRWLETESRDTRGNARRSLQLIRSEGVTHLFVVTHGWHMRRALRAFEREAAESGFSGRIIAAPMGMGASGESALLQWLPSAEGNRRVQQSLRELLGLLMGA